MTSNKCIIIKCCRFWRWNFYYTRLLTTRERGKNAKIFTTRVWRFMGANSCKSETKGRWFSAAFNYLQFTFKQASCRQIKSEKSVVCVNFLLQICHIRLRNSLTLCEQHFYSSACIWLTAGDSSVALIRNWLISLKNSVSSLSWS